MDNFTFHGPTKIIFGKATENKVGAEVKRYSQRYCYGGGSIKEQDYMTE